MKRISVQQSRRNSARRKRKVSARHAKAGHWKAQGQPMFNSGRVHYEVGANTDATSFGGIAAVHRLVTELGLPDRIDANLELLKVHLPYHESDHVLNLAYNVLCGGTRLEDIERLRHDTAYIGTCQRQWDTWGDQLESNILCEGGWDGRIDPDGVGDGPGRGEVGSIGV